MCRSIVVRWCLKRRIHVRGDGWVGTILPDEKDVEKLEVAVERLVAPCKWIGQK